MRGESILRFKDVKFHRLVKTPHSENYLVWRGKKRIASIDIHYGNTIDATVIFETDLTENEITSFLYLVGERIISVGDQIRASDFIVQVYRGKYVEQWDGFEFMREIPDAREAVEDLHRELRKYVGRSERALGDVAEDMTKEYYEKEGYEVEKTSPEVDTTYKIDLIATKGNEIRLIQVKKGQVSSREISEAYEKGRELSLRGDFGDYTSKIIEVVAPKHIPYPCICFFG